MRQFNKQIQNFYIHLPVYELFFIGGGNQEQGGGLAVRLASGTLGGELKVEMKR